MTDAAPPPEPPTLLAVDVGLATGLALFGRDGRLRACRSHHLASRSALRAAALRLFRDQPALDCVVLEGGGPVADVWRRAAERHAVRVLPTIAEVWRARLLLPREQRTGRAAKRRAIALAHRVAVWSGVPPTTPLRHDTAEAVLVGLWGVLELGWLERLPRELTS